MSKEGAARCCQVPMQCLVEFQRAVVGAVWPKMKEVLLPQHRRLLWHGMVDNQRGGKHLTAANGTVRNGVERLATQNSTADAPTFMAVYAVAVVWAHEYSVPTEWNPVIAMKSWWPRLESNPSHRSQSVVTRPQGQVAACRCQQCMLGSPYLVQIFSLRYGVRSTGCHISLFVPRFIVLATFTNTLFILCLAGCATKLAPADMGFVPRLFRAMLGQGQCNFDIRRCSLHRPARS